MNTYFSTMALLFLTYRENYLKEMLPFLIITSVERETKKDLNKERLNMILSLKFFFISRIHFSEKT